MGTGNAALEGFHAAFNLGNHARRYDSGRDHGRNGDMVNTFDEARRIIDVAEHSGNIRELDELFRAERDGNLGSGGISVDVVAVRVALLTERHGGNNRNVTLTHERDKDFGLNRRNLAHKAEINAVLVDLLRPEEPRVHPAHADRPATRLQEEPDNILVELAGEHHLHDFHGFGVGVAKSVYEFRFLAGLLEHGVDLGTAAVYEHGVHPDGIQQDDVLHDRGFEFFVEHGVTAVLYDNRFPRVLFKVRERLDKNGSPVFIFQLMHHVR